MKEYQIVKLYTQDSMEKVVSDYLNRGWRLVGGIQVIQNNDKKSCFPLIYLQAVEK